MGSNSSFSIVICYYPYNATEILSAKEFIRDIGKSKPIPSHFAILSENGVEWYGI